MMGPDMPVLAQSRDFEPQKRLFFALELSESWRHAAVKAQQSLKTHLGNECCRWVAPEDMHLTLLFLGEQLLSRLPEIVQTGLAAAEACAPFRLTLAAPGAFPGLKTPRVLWLGARDDRRQSAFLLAADLRAPLDPWISDKKPLRLHITLAYVRQRASLDDFGAVFGSWKDDSANRNECARALPPLEVSQFVLLESMAGKPYDKTGESRYNPVHSFLLKGSGESFSRERPPKGF